MNRRLMSVALLAVLLVAVGAARPVSENEAMAAAGGFVGTVFGPSSAGGCWYYEDLAGGPGVYVCEHVLESGSGVTVMVGARTEMPPVLLYYQGEPLNVVSAQQAEEAAARALGTDAVRQVASVYYSPLDLWFEYEGTGKRVMVSPLSFRVSEPEEVRAVKPLAIDVELARRSEAEWKQYFAGSIPFELDGQYWITGVADWDWHYGCAPTAAANALTYWDNNGYDLLVDFVWYNVWDPLEHDSDSVPNVSQQLAIAMNTDTLTGSTRGDSVAPGIVQVCNAPAWANNYAFNSYTVLEDRALMISEINADRPGVLLMAGHPTYGNHAVTYCGWGPPDDNWFMIHDEWSNTPVDVVIYYWYGSGPRYVVPVIPGPPLAPDPDMAVTSIVKPEVLETPAVIQPQAYIANLGGSAAPCSVFFYIDRQGGGVEESFTGTVFPPPGWFVNDFDGNTPTRTWQRSLTDYRTAPACVRCERQQMLLDNDDWLITPKVRVRPSDTLQFWFRSLGTDMESIAIWVSFTDSSPINFSRLVQAFDFNNQTYQFGWAEFSGVGDTTVYIGFHYGMSNGLPGSGICLDDIRLKTNYYADSRRVENPGASQLVSFDYWIAKEGHYVARCSVAQAGDANPGNDVRTKDFVVTPTPVPPSNWSELKEMPGPPSNEPVKQGGCLTLMENTGMVYAMKGNKTGDFYYYSPSGNYWVPLTPIPAGTKSRMPKRGAKIAAAPDRYVYLVRGNNTADFLRFDTHSNSWEVLESVPYGSSGKRVKGGGDAAYVEVGGTGYVYLLKGYKTDFMRYNTATAHWEPLASAPTGSYEKWKPGSFIVHDQGDFIYAHKAKQHELWRYHIPSSSWFSSEHLEPMPYWGKHSSGPRQKKLRDGGNGTWHNGGIYALKGGNTQQFFKYNAGGNYWVELDTMPRGGSSGSKKRVKYGADIVNVGNAFYALKGNKTRELWHYAAGSMRARRLATDGPTAAGNNGPPLGFSLLPNPATEGHVTLRYALPDHGPAQVAVYDVLGREVGRTEVPATETGTIELDTRKLSAGVYLVRLEAGGLTGARRLVIQR